MTLIKIIVTLNEFSFFLHYSSSATWDLLECTMVHICTVCGVEIFFHWLCLAMIVWIVFLSMIIFNGVNKSELVLFLLVYSLALNNFRRQHGQVARALDLKSWSCFLVNPSSTPQSCVFFSLPSLQIANWPATCQWGFLTMLCSFVLFVSSFSSIGPEKPHWGSGQQLRYSKDY